MSQIVDEAGHVPPNSSNPAFQSPTGRTLYLAAKWSGILGGLVIFGLALMLVITIFSRKVFLWQVTGDYELVRLFGALGGSLLFPWCALVGGNVVVDLITSGLPPAINQILDRIGTALVALVAALFAWRTGVLAMDSYDSLSISPMLAWHVWIWQALMVPGLALTAVIAAFQTLSPTAFSHITAGDHV